MPSHLSTVTRSGINSHIYDYLVQFGSLGGVLEKLCLHLIWLTFVRVLWKERNGHIFQQSWYYISFVIKFILRMYRRLQSFVIKLLKRKELIWNN